MSCNRIQAEELQNEFRNNAAAEATELFDMLCVATTMRQILGLHRNMCDLVGLRPSRLNEFYPKLKSKVRSWRAQALWKKFDNRASHKVYDKGNACIKTRVLVLGAGPCGLRTAIEAQLLGAKVVVVEKRDRISRNNVLHLWPFVISDLRNLGAKKFYGKFCAGSIDHISIRQLQCILLKVALLLGVEVHEGVSFKEVVEPDENGSGWRACFSPSNHPVSHYEYDVLVGADGKQNMLGFKRKEFRGKLAIAITANFVNKKSEAEAKVEEISGVAFIFNQRFFKDLYSKTGIDLENIVYYKDETHYFVMTAKKHSLIDKGVIKEDLVDPGHLLSPPNVDVSCLYNYAREAAEFSTRYQMPDLEFAVNHYGNPDVALFDFTSMFAAEMSCRAFIRRRFRLLQCLVGDSLLEPFWPTGSGCARGFLSSMDVAYTIKLWANTQNTIEEVLAQRESVYRLLGQATPDTLQRDLSGYTINPSTRYPNLNRSAVSICQVSHLIDTDEVKPFEKYCVVNDPNLTSPIGNDNMLITSESLLKWIKLQLSCWEFTIELENLSDVVISGKALCALINRYRPHLLASTDFENLSPIESNKLAFEIFEKELYIPPVVSAEESVKLPLASTMPVKNYLNEICKVFRGEVPHTNTQYVSFQEMRRKCRMHLPNPPDFSKLLNSKSNSLSTESTEHQHESQIRSGVATTKPNPNRRLQRSRYRSLMSANSEFGYCYKIGTVKRTRKRNTADRTMLHSQGQLRNNLDRPALVTENCTPKQHDDYYQRVHDLCNKHQLGSIENTISDKEKELIFDHCPDEVYEVVNHSLFGDRVKELERKLFQQSTDRSQMGLISTCTVGELQLNNRIQKFEERTRLQNKRVNNKKPKDLMRAIGRIDSNDWNIRQIEEKIMKSKKPEVSYTKNQERVPNWSKQDFQARQQKILVQPGSSSENLKYKLIDETLKKVDRQLKEGHILDVGERGRNKVSAIADQFVKYDSNMDKESVTQHKEKDIVDVKENVLVLSTNTPIVSAPNTTTRHELSSNNLISNDEASTKDDHEWSDSNFSEKSDKRNCSISSVSGRDTDSPSDSSNEARDSPETQTLQIVTDWIGKQYCSRGYSAGSYDSSEEVDESDFQDDTECEEFRKARELRRKEVAVLPPTASMPTDTETEVNSGSDTTFDDEFGLNSTTEVSTDSEFNYQAPKIFVNDVNIRKSIGSPAKKSICYSKGLTNTTVENSLQNNVAFRHFEPLVEVNPNLLPDKTGLYNRTGSSEGTFQKIVSTEGIAFKKGLELKKKYLFGESIANESLYKSGSASVVNLRLRSFQNHISECQKLLNANPGDSVKREIALSNTIYSNNAGVSKNVSLQDLLPSVMQNKNTSTTDIITLQKSIEEMYRTGINLNDECESDSPKNCILKIDWTYNNNGNINLSGTEHSNNNNTPCTVDNLRSRSISTGNIHSYPAGAQNDSRMSFHDFSQQYVQKKPSFACNTNTSCRENKCITDSSRSVIIKSYNEDDVAIRSLKFVPDNLQLQSQRGPLKNMHFKAEHDVNQMPSSFESDLDDDISPHCFVALSEWKTSECTSEEFIKMACPIDTTCGGTSEKSSLLSLVGPHNISLPPTINTADIDYMDGAPVQPLYSKCSYSPKSILQNTDDTTHISKNVFTIINLPQHEQMNCQMYKNTEFSRVVVDSKNCIKDQCPSELPTQLDQDASLLSKKLEEILIQRNKENDVIRQLVMEKLQYKKPIAKRRRHKINLIANNISNFQDNTNECVDKAHTSEFKSYYKETGYSKNCPQVCKQDCLELKYGIKSYLTRSVHNLRLYPAFECIADKVSAKSEPSIAHIRSPFYFAPKHERSRAQQANKLLKLTPSKSVSDLLCSNLRKEQLTDYKSAPNVILTRSCRIHDCCNCKEIVCSETVQDNSFNPTKRLLSKSKILLTTLIQERIRINSVEDGM